MKLITKQALYNEHYPSILVTFLEETEHFSGENGALRWSILVGKQKHNEKTLHLSWLIYYVRKLKRMKKMIFIFKST